MLDFLFTKTPLFYFIQSIWRDEAFTYLLTKESIPNIFYFASKDFTPPLYTLLLKFWIWIFGSSEIAMRSLSLLFYILSAYFFYLFLVKIIKIKTVWKYLYMGLFLLNPMLHYFAFEARTYSLLFLITIMSFYFLLSKKYKAYLISISIGLFTHYFMFMVISVEIIYILISEKRPIKIIKKMAIPFLLFFPWFIFVLKQNNLVNEPFWINEVSKDHLKLIPAILYSGYETGFYYLNEIASNLNLTIFSYLFAGIFLFYRGKIKNKKIFYLLLLWTLLPALITLAVSNIKPVFLSRYLIISTTGLLLILVFINEHLSKFVKYILFSILLIQTFNYAVIQVENRNKAPYRKVISEIKSQSKQNDLLYVENELDFHIAKYYFDDKRVFIFNKNYEEIPNYVGKVLIPIHSIKKTIPLYPVKAFILYHNLSYDVKTVF